MASEAAPVTHKKHLVGTVAVGGVATRLRRGGSVLPRVPEELSRPLTSVIRALWFISISAVIILILSGFGLFGFALDYRVLIAIIGGVSLQYVAAIVSPLVRGITDVLVAQIRDKRD